MHRGRGTACARPLCHLDYGIERSPLPVLPRLAPGLRFGQCQFNLAYFKALNLLEVLEFEHVLIEKGDQLCWDMLQGRGSVAVVLGVGWRHQAFETPQKVFLGHPVELHIAQGIGCHALGR